jgi:hypothetical protein
MSTQTATATDAAIATLAWGRWVVIYQGREIAVCEGGESDAKGLADTINAVREMQALTMEQQATIKTLVGLCSQLNKDVLTLTGGVA